MSQVSPPQCHPHTTTPPTRGGGWFRFVSTAPRVDRLQGSAGGASRGGGWFRFARRAARSAPCWFRRLNSFLLQTRVKHGSRTPCRWLQGSAGGASPSTTAVSPGLIRFTPFKPGVKGRVPNAEPSHSMRSRVIGCHSFSLPSNNDHRTPREGAQLTSEQ